MLVVRNQNGYCFLGFGYKIGTQFKNSVLVVEENNYVTKIIIHQKDNSLKNPLNNFSLKNCLFGAANIVKINDKSKYVYSAYGIVFDGAYSWSFSNELVFWNWNFWW